MGFLERLKPKKKNQFTRNNERYYKIILTIFISLYVLVFSLNIAFPNESTFLSTENGEWIQSEGYSQFKVINRFYDKESRTYQLTLWMTGETDLKEDYQLEMVAKSITQSDINTEKRSELTRIGRQYFTIVVSDIPEDYQAVRTDIT